MKPNKIRQSVIRIFVLAVIILAAGSFASGLQAQDDDAYKEHRTVSTVDPISRVKYYLKLARHAASDEDGYFKANQYVDTAMNIMRTADSKYAEMLCMSTLGSISSRRNYYTDALSYYNRALSLSIRLDETDERPFIYNNIGYIMRHSGNYEEAVKILLRGLEIAQSSENIKAQGYILNGLAASYLMIDNYDKALQYYREALLPAEKINNKKSKAMNYAGIGEAYFLKDQYSEAENFYRQALDLNLKIQDFKGQAVAYIGLGNIYYEDQEFALAEENYLKALQAVKNDGSKYYMTEILLELAKITVNDRRYSQAADYIDRALLLAEEINSKEDKSKAYKLKADLYREMNRPSKALQNLLKYNKLKDSLLDYQIEKSVLSAQLKYDLERSREQIVSLEQEKSAQAQRDRFKLIAVVISAVALIIVVVAGLLFRLVKQKEKTNKTLKQLLQKNQILLSEMHHRIKNNFAVIIGLLRLQKKDIDKKTGLLATEDTINRIYTYAAIHEQAYGEKDYTKINIGKFIKELAQRIRKKTNRPLVEIVPHTQAFYPDLSTAVSMALYSNEILSNAFEHGFDENDSGLVKIDLSESKGNVRLQICNTGKKPPQGFSVNSVDSAGLHIAKLYAGQLKGSFQYNESDRAFILSFALSKKKGGPLNLSHIKQSKT